MKKKLLFIFAFFVLFINLEVINAKDVFEFAWNNDDFIIADYDKGFVNSEGEVFPFVSVRDNNYEFLDGYVTSFIEMDVEKEEIVTTLKYYDKDGKVVRTIELGYTILFSLKSYNNDLYAMAIEFDNELSGYKIKLLNFNKDLVIVREKDLTDLVIETTEDGNDNMLETIVVSILPKIIGYDNISVVDDKIALLYSTSEFILIDREFKNAEEIEFSNAMLKKYFVNMGFESKHIIDFGIASENGLPKELYISTDANGKSLVSGGVSLNSNPDYEEKHGLVIPMEVVDTIASTITAEAETSAEQVSYDFLEIDAKLGLFDKNYNLLWEVVDNNYLAYLDTHIVNNYIVTIGVNLDLPESFYDEFTIEDDSSIYGIIDVLGAVADTESITLNTDILIYDMEGNLVQKIGDNSFYLGLFPSKSGFIVTNIKGIDDSLNSTSDEEVAITMSNEVWNIFNIIKTNVVGGGTITVPENSLAGEKITFTVVPEEGYVLSAIKIIDAEGNIIIVTDNQFVMPSADVTIEAIFVKNPETSDVAVIAIIMVLLVSICLLIYNKKKVDFLK